MANQFTAQRDQVIEVLKNYPQKKKQISLLRYELEHPSHISEKELIESLSLAKSEAGGGKSPGHISNKTMMIALQYQDTAQRMNGDVVAEITQELSALEAEVERIDYYLTLLDEGQALVLRRYYIEQKPWAEIENEFNLSQRALIKRRDDGVAELAEMFGFLGRIRGE